MQKFLFSIGAVIALVTMLLTPSIPIHLVKASSCLSIASKHGGASNAGPITGTGSCSASAAVGSGPLSLSAATSQNHRSGCTSASAGPDSFSSSQSQDSNIGGVSCASHSP